MKRITVLLFTGMLVLFVAGCGRRRAPVKLDASASPAAKPPLARAAAVKMVLPQPVASGFVFEKDEGGKLLAKMLLPKAMSMAARRQTSPRPLSAPGTLEHPALNLPLAPVSPVLPAVHDRRNARNEPRPHMLPGDPPLSHQVAEATPPAQTLPTSPLTRIEAAKVEQVPPLPTLSPAIHDRASLDDPTAAYSLASVLHTSAPPRAQPLPPWFLNLPDPFEHRRVVGIKTLPPEDAPSPP